MKHPIVLLTLLTFLLTLGATSLVAQEEVSASIAPGTLAAKTAADYRQQARYPDSSWPLTAGSPDPILDEWIPSRQIVKAHADGPSLALWREQLSFTFPEPVDLFAEVQGTKVWGGLKGEVVRQSGEVVATFTYLDDGQGADREAGDGIFSARLDFMKGLEPELADAYLVKVEALLGDKETLSAVDGFLYSRPWGRLTGAFKEQLIDGNIVISAEIDVERSGRFHLAGTLYAADGAPMGMAQTAGKLAVGRQWVDLSFYGLMFHDRKATGPFTLGSIALTTAGGMPNAKSAPWRNSLRTKAYGLEQLNAKAFGHADLLKAAEDLEVESAFSKMRASENR